jgi:hypothetical protein
MRNKLPLLIENFEIDFSKKEFVANGVTITSDI